jgi:hypothetical protein
MPIGYLKSSSKLNIDIPHHFICVKRTENDILVLACCTAQFNTISNNNDHPFKKETYINCNDCFIYTVREFESMNDSEIISFF